MPEPETAERPASASPTRKPIFKAREGLSADFSDIVPPPEPTLGLDEALGVRWLKLRGKLTGIRYGTLRQRRNIELAMQRLAEDQASKSEPDKDAEYQSGIMLFQTILVLPSQTAGIREMTQDEIEERVDMPDLDPLIKLAFPPVSPLQALVDADANPN